MSIFQFTGHKPGGNNLRHVPTQIVANVGNGQLISEDCFIHEIQILNYGGQAAPLVTVLDGNGHTFAFGASSICGAGTSLFMESQTGSPCDGGLNVTCDTANACKVKVVWRKVDGN